MRHITRTNVGQDTLKTVDIERLKLEASVNSEIAIALKMADSPLIKQYFMNPRDTELEALALEEIAGYRRAFTSNSVFWVNDVDKRFFSDDAYAFTVDTNDPNNYWYLMTLNETEKYNFNINYNPDLDVTNLWINAPVFYDKKPIGILGTGINLSAFIDDIYKDYSGNAEMYFFNNSGEITGARNTELVAQKVSLEKQFGKTGTDITEQSQKLGSGEQCSFGVPEGEIAVGSIPLLDWYITVIRPIALADYTRSPMTFLFLAVMTVIMIIVVIFNMAVSGFIRPLSKMVDTLNLISTDWDLTRRLDIREKDEIGTLGTFFNQTFDKMLYLLRDIKSRAFTLDDNGDELAATMNETAAAIGDINDNIKNMKNQILTQTGQVNTSTLSTEQIIHGLENLNKHIEIQAESVSRSSSAIEEMLANIRSVTDTLVKNTANINSLAESSETGRVDLEKVVSDIQEIAKESEGLLEINSVMENISSQTNLLSMNAAIEAAHAGESGRGFAVVAGEIRKLAENSGKQSKTISSILKKIKVSIDTITKSTAVVLERFRAIEGDVKIVSNQELQIRSAMEEQETGSRDILEAINQLNSVTAEVKSASAEMTKESGEMVTESGKLKQVTEEVAGGMDKLDTGVEQINTAVHRVNEISLETKDNIGTLNGEINKFKVE
jgi:methyl-accepting chemotaxis protein